jgi:hypothetical protein
MIGSVKHVLHRMSPPVRAQQPTVPFLVGAVVSFAIAYSFYTSATGAPDVNVKGFVLVLTDDPKISLKVELEYARYVKKSTGSSRIIPEEWGKPNVGDDQIKSLLLTLSRTSKKDSKQHRYLAIFSGDARLRDVALYESIKAQSTDKVRIESRTALSESDIQTYEGTIPDIGSRVAISGELMKPVADTAAGKTFVRIPSLGSIMDAPFVISETTFEAVDPGQVLVSGKRWFSPKSVNYVAQVGHLQVGKSIDEEQPLRDAKHPNEIQWSGTEVLFPRAQLSDNIAEQEAQKRIFLAGVLAGISGGFLVEGISRLRPRRRYRQKEQTETAQS